MSCFFTSRALIEAVLSISNVLSLEGVIFPVHSHIALNYVIGDYVPKASRSIARAGLLGATIIAAAGIMKLNFTGPGLTDVIKSLWRSPKKIEAKV